MSGAASVFRSLLRYVCEMSLLHHCTRVTAVTETGSTIPLALGMQLCKRGLQGTVLLYFVYPSCACDINDRDVSQQYSSFLLSYCILLYSNGIYL